MGFPKTSLITCSFSRVRNETNFLCQDHSHLFLVQDRFCNKTKATYVFVLLAVRPTRCRKMKWVACDITYWNNTVGRAHRMCCRHRRAVTGSPQELSDADDGMLLAVDRSGVDKLLAGSWSAHAVRWSEVVGRRSWRRDGFDRILHWSEDDLSSDCCAVDKRLLRRRWSEWRPSRWILNPVTNKYICRRRVPTWYVAVRPVAERRSQAWTVN